MRNNNYRCDIWGRRITVLLLLCGLLLPLLQQSSAATVIYEYKWIKASADLPTDDKWHDYFIAWEDLDDKNKFWFTDYHWYTADGDNNIDEGGSHWMEYKAASYLSNHTAEVFTSKESMGHMQIKYAGRDKDNGNSPMYYIRVSKMNGGYSYFTSYEPTDKENSADAFTFQDKGDVFHIFVNITGKADRYLTRDGQYLETTESSSYGGGEYYRPLRVYRRTFTVDQTEQDTNGDVIGKVTLHEYTWANTVEELMALANSSKNKWVDVLLAWEDADGYGTTNPDKVWYTKEVWFEESKPNYNSSAGNEWNYWSNDYLGSDGYGSPYVDSFLLPSKVGHFQVKLVDWDDDNPVHGYTNAQGKKQDSPVFHFRFDIGHGKYIYIGNDALYEDPDEAEEYTVQLRLGQKDAEDLFGSVWLIANLWGEDEMITRCENNFNISDWGYSGYWEFPFRFYTHREVEYDAIVKSFTVGKGATYSIRDQLIIDYGVSITVENGGVLMVDDQLLNNGQIIVKNGGTVIVNEGGYIMAYDNNAYGRITLDGGNLIIMDGAKVICDQSGGILQADHGSTILNRGLLMVGRKLVLNQNSYVINEANSVLLFGGNITQERGSVADISYDEVVKRVSSGMFTYVCGNGSKVLNKGVISEPNVILLYNRDDMKNITNNVEGGTVKNR